MGDTGDIDYISNLPNEILCDIMKIIPSTRDVAATSVLSKRWRNVWIGMEILDFDDSSLDHSPFGVSRSQREFNFMKFVEIPLFCSRNYLKKFRLRRAFPQLDNDFHIAHAWISVAIKRNVEEVELEFLKYNVSVSLPSVLFKSDKMVVLKLQGDIWLGIPDSVYLPNLKVLYLEFIEYENDDSPSKLFAACPILEKLVITRARYDNVVIMNVSLPVLRSLRVVFQPENVRIDRIPDSEDSDDFDDVRVVRRLNVDCPKLEDFHLEDFMSEYFSLKHLSSLSEAHIDVGRSKPEEVKDSFENSTSELFHGIQEVRFLSFPTRMMEILAYNYDVELPIIFSNLIRLEIGASNVNCWNKLLQLLERMPQLEVLIISEAADEPFDVGYEDWTPPAQVPECFSSYLKEIVIEKFRGCEFEAIEYILENAHVLDLMTIRCKTSDQVVINRIENQLNAFYTKRASESCCLICNDRVLCPINDNSNSHAND